MPALVIQSKRNASKSRRNENNQNNNKNRHGGCCRPLWAKIINEPEMKVTRYIFCFAALMLSSSCFQGTDVNNENLRVYIESVVNEQTTVDIDGQLMPCITITFKIINQSESSKFINMMSCSWMDSWILDPSVYKFYYEGCDGNFPKQVEIKPNQSITYTGQIFKTDTTIESNQLRAGFINFTKLDLVRKPIQLDSINNETDEIFWSNWITI